MEVYLTDCQICGEKYTDSTKTKFRPLASDYKSTQRKFVNKEEVPKQALKQNRFPEHYCSDRHSSIEDWVITLIDCADTLKELRRKELCWLYKLKGYALYDLNERDVYEAFQKLTIDCWFAIYNKVTRRSINLNMLYFYYIYIYIYIYIYLFFWLPFFSSFC